MQAALLDSTDVSCPSISFSLDSRIPVISLRLNAEILLCDGDPWSKPILIVTVNLYPASVRQQWSTRPPPLTKPDGQTIPPAIALTGRGRAYKGAEYHLSCDTLDHYANLHGLRLSHSEISSRTYLCPIFIRLTHLYLSVIESPKAVSPSFLDHFGLLFCAQLAHIQLASKSSLSQGGLNTRQKRRVTEILDQNRPNNVKLAELARECGLSLSHFARSFKISFGISVHQWIIAQRIESAKALLLDSGIPLIEVAFLSGFCDQAAFNRMFARFTGQTPGRWRNAVRDGGARGPTETESRDKSGMDGKITSGL
jgi:AraC family transcriptional regulator